MPSYRKWTVSVVNTAQIHLEIDGQFVNEFCFGQNEKRPKQNQSNFIPSSSEITSMVALPPGHVQISLGKTSLNLQVSKFEKAELFGKCIENTEELLQFWNTHGDFLRSNLSDEEQSNDDDDDDDSIAFFATDRSGAGATECQDKDNNDSNLSSQQITDNSKDENTTGEPKISDFDEYSNTTVEPQISDFDGDNNPQISDYDDDNNSSRDEDPGNRADLMASISKKLASFSVMDIFTLHSPPPSYRVRDVNNDFVKKLANIMIEKNSVSVDNAPTLVGFVNMKKSDFKQENLSTYKVYVIDGNHSLKAQRAAYRKTGDTIFKHRGVNIYCDLTEDEALLLGVSRNEDTGSFVSFSDFQKVDLIRRKLYSMTNTPMENDPPKPPKQFKNIFACMLNLHGKKAVDGKNIIRFLATALTHECYILFRDICKRNNKIPASKFGCLRGLSTSDALACLQELSETSLQKDDWQNFTSICVKKQKKGRKLKKVVLATVEFGQTTQVFINQKLSPGNFLYFKFSSNGSEKTFTSKELEDLVFKSNNQNIEQQSSRWQSLRNVKKCVPKTIMTLSPSKLGPNIYKRHFMESEGSNPLCNQAMSADSKPDELHSNSMDTDISDEDYDSGSRLQKATFPIKDYSKKSQSQSLSSDNTSRCSSPLLSSTPIDSLPCDVELIQEKSEISRQYNYEVDIVENKPSCSKEETRKKKSQNIAFEFIKILVDEGACIRAKVYGTKIEENDVEDIPEKLYPDRKILLDPVVQELSKKYFTDDAWLQVTCTLKILEEYHCKPMQSNDDTDVCFETSKGKALFGSKGRDCFKNKQDFGKHVAPSFKEADKETTGVKCAIRKSRSLKRTRDVYSFSSDDSPVKAFEIPVKAATLEKTDRSNKVIPGKKQEIPVKAATLEKTDSSSKVIPGKKQSCDKTSEIPVKAATLEKTDRSNKVIPGKKQEIPVKAATLEKTDSSSKVIPGKKQSCDKTSEIPVKAATLEKTDRSNKVIPGKKQEIPVKAATLEKTDSSSKVIPGKKQSCDETSGKPKSTKEIPVKAATLEKTDRSNKVIPGKKQEIPVKAATLEKTDSSSKVIPGKKQSCDKTSGKGKKRAIACNPRKSVKVRVTDISLVKDLGEYISAKSKLFKK